MKHARLSLLILALLPFTMLAQKTLTGTVTDNTNFPLAGATILEKGTTNGQITDFDGAFTIVLDKTPTTIVVSYLGFITKELTITDQNSVKIVLTEDKQQLDEVVVIGYGSVQKSDLTGAITSLKPKDEDVDNPRGIQGILQGKAAGVQVTSLGNEPGAPSSIKIRGINSLTSSTEPLYVIDGVIIDSSGEDTLDPLGNNLAAQQGIGGVNARDIENIQILKDASATAIYGSRGSNGVILITTKKGRIGKARFNFSASTKIGNIANNIEVLEASEYANYRNLQQAEGEESFYIYPNGSITAWVKNEADNTNVSEQFMIDNASVIPRLTPADWTDIYRTSIGTNYRLSASGGSENGNYYVAGGYIKNEGVIPRSSSENIDFALNINQNLSDKLKLGVRFSTSFTDNSASKGTEGLGDSRFNIIRKIISYAPFLKFEENIESDDFDTENLENFVDGPQSWINGYDDLSKETRIQGSVKLDYKISDVFTYRFLFGGDYRYKQRQVYYGLELTRGAQVNGEAGLATLNRFRYNIDNTLMFKKTFNKAHKIDGTVGFIYDSRKAENIASSGSNFPNQALRANGVGFAENFSNIIYGRSPETIISYLGRLNYTLLNKYIFTGTFRGDGSSKFSKNNRWGYFPSAAFAWKINNEGFLKKADWLTQAKLRIGWGITGNQRIPPFQYLANYGNSNVPLSNASGGISTSIIPTNLENENLKWEETTQYSVGLDFGLFENRFTANVDVYHKDINDLLLYVDLPDSAGFSRYYANQGSVSNEGLEVGLSADIIDNDKFSWNVYGNIAFNENEITDLGIPTRPVGQNEYSYYFGDFIGGDISDTPNIFIEGQPVGLFWGYETNGIVSDASLPNAPDPGQDPEVGHILYVDQNEDGIIDQKDKTIIGNPSPDFTYGFGSSFTYGNASLSFFFNGVYGNEVINGGRLQYGITDNNSPKNITKDAFYNAYNNNPDSAYYNPNGTLPAVGYDYFNVKKLPDYVVEDASFLRLSNVTFSYSIPTENIKGINGINISLSGQNLLLFTDYSGFDPEVNSFSFDSGKIGIDWNSFPNQRRFTLGVNVSF